MKKRLVSQKKVSKLEQTPSFGKNKVQLTSPAITYWEIKHHNNVTQHDLKSERYRVRTLNCQDHGQASRDIIQHSVHQHPNQMIPSRQWNCYASF